MFTGVIIVVPADGVRRPTVKRRRDDQKTDDRTTYEHRWNQCDAASCEETQTEEESDEHHR